MNKAMTKMMLALAICGMMATGAMAAPRHGDAKDRRAPSSVRTKTPAHHAAKKPAKTTVVTVRETPAQVVRHKPACRDVYEPRREVVYVRDGRDARRDPPRHHHRKDRDHHNTTLHSEDWCVIGASAVVGVLGGLIGAAL